MFTCVVSELRWEMIVDIGGTLTDDHKCLKFLFMMYNVHVSYRVKLFCNIKSKTELSFIINICISEG